jgi:hypothetical protein
VINTEYLARNPEAEKGKVIERMGKLFNLTQKQIGLIELDPDLDINIEKVMEIFIRINTRGVVLEQADFAMSKIATNTFFVGQRLRKAIDYFCHLAVVPEFYAPIHDNGLGFVATDYFKKMAWLRNENDELYDQAYTDMLWLSFGTELPRAKLQDLMSLFSERNFKTRNFEEEITEALFGRLRSGVSLTA